MKDLSLTQQPESLRSDTPVGAGKDRKRLYLFLPFEPFNFSTNQPLPFFTTAIVP